MIYISKASCFCCLDVCHCIDWEHPQAEMPYLPLSAVIRRPALKCSVLIYIYSNARNVYDEFWDQGTNLCHSVSKSLTACRLWAHVFALTMILSLKEYKYTICVPIWYAVIMELHWLFKTVRCVIKTLSELLVTNPLISAHMGSFAPRLRSLKGHQNTSSRSSQR